MVQQLRGLHIPNRFTGEINYVPITSTTPAACVSEVRSYVLNFWSDSAPFICSTGELTRLSLMVRILHSCVSLLVLSTLVPPFFSLPLVCVLNVSLFHAYYHSLKRHSMHIRRQLVQFWTSKYTIKDTTRLTNACLLVRITGLLTITQEQYDALWSLFFNIGGVCPFFSLHSITNLEWWMGI